MNDPTVPATETPWSDDDLSTIAEAYGFSLGELKEAYESCLKVAGGDTEAAGSFAAVFMYGASMEARRLRKRQGRQPLKRRIAPRTGTRSRAPRRSPRRGTVKTAQDPGDGDPDPDHDPVGEAIGRLLDSAPPFSVGQRDLLARILGGAR
jgi:hypothetical protein